jgi:hypothetical protein
MIKSTNTYDSGMNGSWVRKMSPGMKEVAKEQRHPAERPSFVFQ